MRRTLIPASILVLAALALAQTATRIKVNGKVVSGAPIVVKGETYVPLKSLQAGGVTASRDGDILSLTWTGAGGSTQTGAVEGGVGDALFDGIWRFKVISVDPAEGGWTIKVELRNGTKQDNLALSGTGFDTLKLGLQDGTLVDCGNPVELTSTGFPQAGGQTFSLNFTVPEGNSSKPDKLLMLIKVDPDLKKYLRDRLSIGYTVPDPSFRVKL